LNIKVRLSVRNELVLEDIITINDAKLAQLTEEEVERAVEIHISEWANRNVSIAWESVEDISEEKNGEENNGEEKNGPGQS